MRDSSSDADEIRRSLGDPERFAVIFDRHFATVHRFLSRRRGPDGAEALTGEVFHIASERRTTYQLDRPDCLPWLYGIAEHLLDKEHRRQFRAWAASQPRTASRTSPSPAPPATRTSPRCCPTTEPRRSTPAPAPWC